MKKSKKNDNEKNVNSEVESLKSQLARALADYSNLQKRVEREKEEGKYISKLVVISRLLPFFDMIRDAQKHSNDAGLGIALKVLSDTLKEEGIEEIKVEVGDSFNEELHEAIDTVLNEEKDNIIESVLLVGYKFVDGPVIRHTKVRVFKKN